MFSKLFDTWMVVNATYNSFRQQVGFCKMQGYDTISRESSFGPSLYTSSDVLFGIGMSDNQFDGRLCGMCVEISHSKNLRNPTNHSLIDFTNDSFNHSFIAMIFDQCTDPICVDSKGFIDFDVYSKTPPVWKGNPYDIRWKAVECPVYEKNSITPKHLLEYLICTPTTCNVNDTNHGKNLASVWNPYYFSFNVRNSRIPIVSVFLNDIPMVYVDGVGWTFSGSYKSGQSFVLKLIGYDGSILLDVFDYDFVMGQKTLRAYRGGVLLQSQHQI